MPTKVHRTVSLPTQTLHAAKAVYNTVHASPPALYVKASPIFHAGFLLKARRRGGAVATHRSTISYRKEPGRAARRGADNTTPASQERQTSARSPDQDENHVGFVVEVALVIIGVH